MCARHQIYVLPISLAIMLQRSTKLPAQGKKRAQGSYVSKVAQLVSGSQDSESSPSGPRVRLHGLHAGLLREKPFLGPRLTPCFCGNSFKTLSQSRSAVLLQRRTETGQRVTIELREPQTGLEAKSAPCRREGHTQRQAGDRMVTSAEGSESRALGKGALKETWATPRHVHQ